MAYRAEGETRSAGESSLGVQIFRLEGEYWTLVYEGVTARLRDTRGLQHLARLLSRPYEELPALALDSPDKHFDTGARSAGASERARVNVTRAIQLAIKRITAYHPALAWHLRNTVKTGNFFAYRPDPRVSPQWEIGDVDEGESPP